MYLEYFKIFNIENYQMRLSLHDPEKLGEKYVNQPDFSPDWGGGAGQPSGLPAPVLTLCWEAD